MKFKEWFKTHKVDLYKGLFIAVIGGLILCIPNLMITKLFDSFRNKDIGVIKIEFPIENAPNIHVTPPLSGSSQPTNPSSIDNKNTVHPAQEDSGSQAQPNTNTQQQNDNILDIDGTDIKEKPKKKKVYPTALPPKSMHDLKPDSVSPLKPAKPQPRTRPAPALAPKSNASEIILRKEAEDNYQ